MPWARQSRKLHTPLAKLNPPRLPAIVERPRLYRLLDGARRRPVIWINAPPGFGKTTLVGGYLRARKAHSLWYQVDEGDSDLATFFHYLGLASKQAAPRYQSPLPHLTPEYLQGLPTFTRRFFESLYARLKPPAFLILDNYQEVSLDSLFHQTVTLGIEALPERMNVLVMSRALPPTAFARLQATRHVDFIGEEVLRLTKEESGRVVRLHTQSQKPVARALAEALHRRVQGWAAGLVLQLEQVEPRTCGDIAVPEGPPQVIFEYFAREVLHRLDPEQQRFLLQTAFLPDIQPTMAEQLTGQATAGDMLSHLYQSRYFTERRMSTADPVYQYHPLFREFLRTQAKALLSSNELASIQRTAASLLEEAERFEDAITLYYRAGYIDEIVRLILSQAQTLFQQGRTQTLEGWLKLIPAEQYDKAPWLLYWLGACRQPVDPVESEDLFARAFERFKAQNDTTGMFMAWAGAVSAIQHSWLNIDRLDRWIDVLHDFLLPDVVFPSVEVETHVTSFIITALMWRRPHSALMNPWVGRAKTLLATSPKMSNGMALSTSMTHLFVWLGDFSSAAKYNSMLRDAAQSQAASPLIKMLFHENNAVLALHRGDAAAVCQIAEEALILSKTTGVHLLDAALLASAINGSLFQNDLIQAEQYLVRCAPLVTSPGDMMHGNQLYCQAWLASLKGDSAKAWDLIQECSKLRWVKGTALGEANLSYAAGMLLHPRNDQRAKQYLQQVKLIGDQVGSSLLQFMSSVLESHFAIEEGENERGLAVLRQALAIGQERGFSYFSWRIPQMMARLCAKALEADIEVEYARDLIRKTGLVPDGDTTANEAWPWPVKIYTLGRFEIHLDGKPLPPRRKAPYQVLRLLKTIVALGGKDVAVSRLIDTLWPDAEGDRGQENLHKSLQRLRRLLAIDDLIHVRDGKVSLNRQVSWVDATAFQTLIERAGDPQNRQPHAGVQVLEQAMALYRGLFLDGDGSYEWTDHCRERLRHQFAQTVQQVSEWKKAEGQEEAAVACLENGLEADPLAEPIYPRLIRFLHILDRQSEAEKVLARYQKAVAMAGSEPSVEMQHLVKSQSLS